ncbi:MAG: M2 family metallopeptidase, partial [Gemmatimonadales bacterium]
ELPLDLARKMKLLKLGLTMPAPADPELTAELTRIATGMESTYGRGEFCSEEGECINLDDMTEILAASRDPQELLRIWVGWRTISPPMRDQYVRFVELTNAGANELGFDDVGSMWRSNYDMEPNEFTRELDRLWGQVRPLYVALHCHVRDRLSEFYGEDVVPRQGAIPAHVLGNMWAQEWANIYDIVAPTEVAESYDLTEILRENEVDEAEMVRYAERFFTSLGLEPLPETFWERSLLTRPADRDVVCHASAWDVDNNNDVRIKMCIVINAEDFQTIHHELGHNYYQRAYGSQPFLYRGSANDGFHEALGDAIALSVTPKYLVRVGLLESEPDAAADLGLLMRDALDKIAFLPFGLLVDQWRWRVFSGSVAPDEYNGAWWTLREEYQGVTAPVERTEVNFDPGAKYHIPGNTPYTRYFLARILQFQLHRALCEVAGEEGPLNRCTIYGNEEAGRRLNEMMEMGMSRPWPDALEALTGSPEMDATAIIDYFAPLIEWLDEQNAERQCGW